MIQNHTAPGSSTFTQAAALHALRAVNLAPPAERKSQVSWPAARTLAAVMSNIIGRACWQDRSGRAKVTKPRIAAELGLCERTIKRCFAALELLGIIERVASPWGWNGATFVVRVHELRLRTPELAKAKEPSELEQARERIAALERELLAREAMAAAAAIAQAQPQARSMRSDADDRRRSDVAPRSELAIVRDAYCAARKGRHGIDGFVSEPAPGKWREAIAACVRVAERSSENLATAAAEVFGQYMRLPGRGEALIIANHPLDWFKLDADKCASAAVSALRARKRASTAPAAAMVVELPARASAEELRTMTEYVSRRKAGCA